jgi:hypothetical protein
MDWNSLSRPDLEDIVAGLIQEEQFAELVAMQSAYTLLFVDDN